MEEKPAKGLTAHVIWQDLSTVIRYTRTIIFDAYLEHCRAFADWSGTASIAGLPMRDSAYEHPTGFLS